MSIASAREFYEKLIQDPSILDGISPEVSEKTEQILRDRGFDFTIEELEAVLPEDLKTSLQADELSDRDMEPVVGGIAVMTVVGIASLTVGLCNLGFAIKRRFFD